MRVLIVSPGHPDLGGGGAERAAYSLFQRLKVDPRVAKVAFVARVEPAEIGHDGFLGSFRSREDEILAAPPPIDAFTMQASDLDALADIVQSLVQAFSPDVVHIHHVLYWGIEILDLFAAAGVRVVSTFHEFAAICANLGQMVKSSGELCSAAFPAECAKCLPITSGKFFLRSEVIKEMLARADAFTAPSHFLADRLRSWGVPDKPLAVIENLLNPGVVARAEALLREGGDRRKPRRRPVRLGFFAQVTPFKGLDILLEAYGRIPEPARANLEIWVHGTNRHYRESRFGRRLAQLMRKPGVRRLGDYDNMAVIDLMRECDWIVVPSRWWENSPVVIQEARIAARPVIASNLGGMAEKAEPEVDLLAPPGDPAALREILEGIAAGRVRADPARCRELAEARIAREKAILDAHVGLYLGFAGRAASRRSSRPERRNESPVPASELPRSVPEARARIRRARRVDGRGRGAERAAQ